MKNVSKGKVSDRFGNGYENDQGQGDKRPPWYRKRWKGRKETRCTYARVHRISVKSGELINTGAQKKYMNLKGKNIIVTGGAGFGVGSGICKALSEYGARLIINERDEEKMDAVLKRYPGSVPSIADVSNPQEVEELFYDLEKKVGIVDGLVNNAGVGLSKLAHEATPSEFDNLYNIDVKGVWMMSKLFVQQLLKNQATGNIVNISSVHAHSTILKYAIYASAKSAVEGLTRGMAVELGKHNIRVNAIAPGYVHAEQNYDLLKTLTHDPKKWVRDYIENEQVIHKEIQPVDCGYTVAFLLSDLSRSITGQTIYVDNGNTIKLLGALSK